MFGSLLLNRKNPCFYLYILFCIYFKLLYNRDRFRTGNKKSLIQENDDLEKLSTLLSDEFDLIYAFYNTKEMF